MKKKIISIITTGMFLFTMIPSVYPNAETSTESIDPVSSVSAVDTTTIFNTVVGGISWSYSNSTSGTAVNVKPTSVPQLIQSGITSVVIPTTLDGKTVSGIADSAFLSYSTVLKITIPTRVTIIGKDAFKGCVNLVTVNIPSGVTVINDNTFYSCRKINNLILPSALTSVGNSAFYDCDGLGVVTLPQSVTTLGKEVFKNCDNLTTVTLPKSLTLIPYGTFNGCLNLNNLVLPLTVTKIDDYSFAKCKRLTGISLTKITSIGAYAFSECSSLVNVIMPSSITSIGASTFNYCTSLTDVVIPSGLTAIPSRMFYKCSSIGRLSIPSSVKVIPSEMFTDITSLNTIVFTDPGSYANSYAFPTKVTIDSITGYSNSVAVLNSKSKYKEKLSIANKSISYYLAHGGLVTDASYKNLITSLGKYRTNASIDSEVSTTVLDSWAENVESRSKVLYDLKPLVFNTSVSSPQVSGTAIKLISRSTGGLGLVQTRYSTYDGAKWTIIKDYSTTNTVTWAPTKIGTYKVWVDVKDATGVVSSSSLDFIVNATTTLGISKVTTSLQSPQGVGTSININATGTGTGEVQYKFAIKEGTTTTTLKDYSTSKLVVWTPSKLGNYTIVVGVKDSTGNIVYRTTPYVITDTKFRISGITSSLVSPQSVGTSIPLTTKYFNTVGAVSTLYTITSSTSVKTLSSTTGVVSWVPTVAGTYYITAKVTDSVGNTATSKITYVINKLFKINSLTASKPSPVPANTSITLSTVAEGGFVTKQYKYSVLLGTSWTVVRDYSSTSTCSWKPTKPGTYTISVNVKDSSSKILTKKITYVVKEPLVEVSRITFNKKSPQSVNEIINIQATGINGVAPYTYKIVDKFNGVFSTIKDTSAVNSVNWKPTSSGTHTIIVKITDVNGSTTTKEINYIVTPQVTVATFNVSKVSPQVTETSINLSMTVTGGSGTVSKKFLVYDGKTWSTLVGSSTKGTATWKPLKEGTYTIYAKAIDSNGKISQKSMTYVITKGPLRITDFRTYVVSPQKLGTSIIVSAKALGGTGDIKYKFYTYLTFTNVLQEPSYKSTIEWKPTKVGTYSLAVTASDDAGGSVKKIIKYIITE